MIASLGMACRLRAHQCRAIVAARLHLRRDPIYEEVLRYDAGRLSSIGPQLLEEPMPAQGAPVLRLAVARLLLRVMGRKKVVV